MRQSQGKMKERENVWAQLAAHRLCVFHDANNRTFVAPLPEFSSTSALARKSSLSYVRETLLTDLFGIPLALQYDAFGKPHALDIPWTISFSHSLKYLAFSISNNHAVGVDVEAFRPTLEQVAPRVFHASELQCIAAHPRPELARQFLWGAKEAVYKAWGKRELIFREAMRVNQLPDTEGMPFELQFSHRGHARKYTLHPLILPGNEVLVCSTACEILSEPR